MASAPVPSEKLDRWVERYGIADALERWRVAAPDKSAALAFNAIACDSRLLLRLDIATARRLAEQAELIVSHVARGTGFGDGTLAAIAAVGDRVQNWRQYSATLDRHGASMVADEMHDPVERVSAQLFAATDQLQVAVREFPQSREFTAQEMVRYALRMGPKGLHKAGAPLDMVIALSSVRLAARLSRLGRPPARVGDPTSAQCAQVVQIVQQWSVSSGKNPFLIVYDGPRGFLPSETGVLLSDARTCLFSAAEQPAEPGSAGLQVWEAAEEFHAYALISVNCTVLGLLDFEKLQDIASAAARFAQSAIANPELKLPEFPASFQMLGPKAVLATARSFLLDGIRSRRSAAVPSRPA